MGSTAAFGVTNDWLGLVLNLLLLFVLTIWLALIYWTYADAKRRIADGLLVRCATAAALFPFIGTVVYLIVRPPEYLQDQRERELEIAAAEAKLAERYGSVCPYCDFEIEPTFLRCPGCLHRLKQPCVTCGKPLDPGWGICPYCDADVGYSAVVGRPSTRAGADLRRVPEPSAAIGEDDEEISSERAELVPEATGRGDGSNAVDEGKIERDEPAAIDDGLAQTTASAEIDAEPGVKTRTRRRRRAG